MQRKRNIQLLFTLGFLTIATVLLWFFLNRKEEPVDKTIFKVTDLNQVDKIVLTKNQQTIELKFEGARWKVNGQLADRSMIDVLFATLQEAEPKRQVVESMEDSIGTLLKNNGVRVSLYRTDNLQKEFLAGGNNNKTQAYFKNVDEEESYVMVIPGYRVYTSGIFELEENGWKDKYVFNFNGKNFQALKSVFPGNQKNDFEIGMGKAYFEIKGITSIDTAKLNDYLDAVSFLTVDQFVNKHEERGYDSLVSAKPVVELEVSEVSGKTYTLALYDYSSKTSILGIIQGSQPAYFDKKKVAAILKRRDWFIKN
ncbi:MAG TPA: DUF4340 domain-containing protein [Cyclobacteriaceae bacterium]|nr:DUF4340 domain-containing protein [Cyclobacteriaceae bacterium]